MKYGRDVDPELVRRAQARPLLVGQLQDLLDLLEIVDPVAELPAPVVPLLVRDVGPQRRAPADRRRPSAPNARAGSRRLTKGAAQHAFRAAWWATAAWISWASNGFGPPCADA